MIEKLLVLTIGNFCILLLLLYRNSFSLLLGPVCKFYPSCSTYSLAAFQQYFFIRAFIMTATRLVRCHPWTSGGVDEVPYLNNKIVCLNRAGFILGFSHRKDQQ